jgi:IS4 transposase
MKSNYKYVIEQPLAFSVPTSWQDYVGEVSDQKIRFCSAEGVYRLVCFTALGEVYFILTNRFDLKTHEIILLYVYRWQIELFFRCIKRTLKAIHLWSHEQNGIEIQYYLYLTSTCYCCRSNNDARRNKPNVRTHQPTSQRIPVLRLPHRNHAHLLPVML